MSKECISNCPRIQSAIENMNPDLQPELATAAILRACEASYDCDGPTTGEAEVKHGILRRRVTLETVSICGLSVERVAAQDPVTI